GNLLRLRVEALIGGAAENQRRFVVAQIDDSLLVGVVYLENDGLIDRVPTGPLLGQALGEPDQLEFDLVLLDGLLRATIALALVVGAQVGAQRLARELLHLEIDGG